MSILSVLSVSLIGLILIANPTNAGKGRGEQRVRRPVLPADSAEEPDLLFPRLAAADRGYHLGRKPKLGLDGLILSEDSSIAAGEGRRGRGPRGAERKDPRDRLPSLSARYKEKVVRDYPPSLSARGSHKKEPTRKDTGKGLFYLGGQLYSVPSAIDAMPEPGIGGGFHTEDRALKWKQRWEERRR